MAKSVRSKRLKRLRAIRREIVKPLLEPKDAAKLAAQEAALAAPKLPVRISKKETEAMELIAAASAIPADTDANTDMDMDEGNNKSTQSLKPTGKKMKKRIKLAKKNRRGGGRIRRKNV